jgi:hypothetical protein
VNANDATLTVPATAQAGSRFHDHTPTPRQRRPRTSAAAVAGHALQFVAAPSSHGARASGFPYFTTRSDTRSTTSRPRFQAGLQADSKGVPAAARCPAGARNGNTHPATPAL